MADKEKRQNPPPALEPGYSREELIANAEAIFGMRSEVVAGALHGNRSQVLALDEVRQAIKAFLGRRVK